MAHRGFGETVKKENKTWNFQGKGKALTSVILYNFMRKIFFQKFQRLNPHLCRMGMKKYTALNFKFIVYFVLKQFI